jgi:plasmid maintenance system antidote protein VapI
MTPEFWLNLQRMYDLDLARASTDISTIEPLVEASAHP